MEDKIKLSEAVIVEGKYDKKCVYSRYFRQGKKKKRPVQRGQIRR